jgi:hypothetical protein
MVTTRRIQRLRDLIAEIELLPVSPDRDRLLSEFRSRLVDVDTGVTPREILPLREPAAPVRDDGPLQRGRAPEVTRLAPPRRPSSPRVRTEGDRAVPSWTLGLRG